MCACISELVGLRVAHGVFAFCRTVVAQWTTRDFGVPVVRWGEHSGVVQHENNGSYSTYTQLQLCGAPANSQGASETILILYGKNMSSRSKFTLQ